MSRTKSPAARHRQNRRRSSSVRRKIAARVFERDGGICWLCGLAVDPELKHPHPESATMDHIVPHYVGGRVCDANLRLAHAICNEARALEEIELRRVVMAEIGRALDRLLS